MITLFVVLATSVVVYSKGVFWFTIEFSSLLLLPKPKPALTAKSSFIKYLNLAAPPIASNLVFRIPPVTPTSVVKVPLTGLKDSCALAKPKAKTAAAVNKIFSF
ncbi:hypothetical protein [Flavobacterium covae]|uniref:hypothetical protein n=1 Tax=Flavobacterium covae TaxID=2906076 RepID=UPI000B4CFD8C|nr:hypothetical protein [Flavobacterium covae]